MQEYQNLWNSGLAYRSHDPVNKLHDGIKAHTKKYTSNMKGFVVSALLLTTVKLAQCHTQNNSRCRSNATHIGWNYEELVLNPNQNNFRRSYYCEYQTLLEAEQDAYNYLRHRVMQFDLPSLESLGFTQDSPSSPLPDGLGVGLVSPTIQLALQAKIDYEWTDALPKEIWQEYVLNYANVNEPRNNWRPVLHEYLSPLVENVTSIDEAVIELNAHMWQILAPKNRRRIVFQSGSTPLIMDTFSVMAIGHASCSGISIMFVNGLRAVGVPARLVGTPAWHNDRSTGNHNWVEVWKDNQWYFLEAQPASGRVDSLADNVCTRWFCTASRFPNLPNTTRVSAAKLVAVDDMFYRMAWEWNNPSVPGEDRTAYYQNQCSQCV